MSKNISKIHPEVLDSKRKELLEKLVPYTKGFVLGGGTALALQIAHRKSFDFDFFSTSSIKRNLAEKLSGGIEIANISVDSADELTFFTKNGVKITFLYYPFAHAYPLEKLENGLALFSIGDIAVKKVYTIGRRGEYRDYYDLYTILKHNYITFEQLIAKAKKVYGSVFEEKIFFEQLVYFGDLLNFEIIPSSKGLDNPKEVKSFFEGLVKKYIAP